MRRTGIGDEAAPDLAGQLAAVRRLGWSAIELRTVDGVWLADLRPDQLELAGTEVVCLASRIGNWSRPISTPLAADLAELDRLIEHCHRLRCRYVRIMSYPNDGLPEAEWARRVIDRIAALAELAGAAGITLLHENCSGWAGASAANTLRLLEEVGSPALKLLFDTGNGISAGYEAYDLLTRIAGHVAHVHVKDAVAGPVYTVPGAGQARVADCLRLLLDQGYTGALSLEPHLALRPHEGLQHSGEAAESYHQAGLALEALLSQEMSRRVATG
ncbi:sugar phosphate isomerase/epimerase [Crossiella sp. CA-258035]|uniref:sugar phosphate isomerase/epimerase family protein n=1 Tax=Crossiella sp. CA-258035 TaxID=2981138 RepID=UPI0024BC442E|nr:sugar phosphate isomerase/epimerase family protein [Crossiella sp. CA-258035]WHT22856.1 sugar phosphate isomerase/epimerase [Crossiella sp. CA-258035]